MVVFAHDLMGDTRGAVRAIEVDFDGLGPNLFGGVLIIAGDVDAGIEECEVHRSEMVHKTLFEIYDLQRFGDIAWFYNDVHLKARAYLGGEFFQSLLFGWQINERDVRSRLCKCGCDVTSQPAGSSGHESLASLHGELVHERVFGVLPSVQWISFVENIFNIFDSRHVHAPSHVRGAACSAFSWTTSM